MLKIQMVRDKIDDTSTIYQWYINEISMRIQICEQISATQIELYGPTAARSGPIHGKFPKSNFIEIPIRFLLHICFIWNKINDTPMRYI